MRSNRNSLGIRRHNLNRSSLFEALRTKKLRRQSQRRFRSRLAVENLERRNLLAALVGVDFDTSSTNAPTNWTSVSTTGTPSTHSNLVDEDGNATPFDLTITETGVATATCGANQVCGAAATLTSATTPSHTQSLAGLDGQVFTDADPVSLTWSDLTPNAKFKMAGELSQLLQTLRSVLGEEIGRAHV